MFLIKGQSLEGEETKKTVGLQLGAKTSNTGNAVADARKRLADAGVTVSGFGEMLQVSAGRFGSTAAKARIEQGFDNAPRPRSAETGEVRLRLPSLGELREAVRQEARALSAAADSVAGAQRAVERAVEDLARERRREEGASRGEGRAAMDFTQTERAGALGAEQREVLERAAELRDRLEALDRTAWDAGLTDPELHEQLAELRRLLDRALTPELEEALRELQRALDRLDPDAMRAALENLAGGSNHGSPIGGKSTPGMSSYPFWVQLGDISRHLILPTITYTIVYMGEYMLIMRSSLLDVLAEDYILTARQRDSAPSRCSKIMP